MVGQVQRIAYIAETQMLFHKGFIPGAQLFCHILREALTAVLLRQAEAVEVLPSSRTQRTVMSNVS